MADMGHCGNGGVLIYSIHFMTNRPAFALVLAALIASPAASRGEDWPQFRGLNGSGVATGTDPVPTEFSFG